VLDGPIEESARGAGELDDLGCGGPDLVADQPVDLVVVLAASQ
jgi:hypothetical protein